MFQREQNQFDTIEMGTLKIKAFRRRFTSPYLLEEFGSFLQEQYNHLESLALRITQMSYDQLNDVVQKIYMDKMPGHTEHVQCFSFPECSYPQATSCVGCPNSIPKAYILITIKNEIDMRLKRIINTTFLAEAIKEKTWVLRFLQLLQDAADSFGKQYVESFIELATLKDRVICAFSKLENLRLGR